MVKRAVEVEKKVTDQQAPALIGLASEVDSVDPFPWAVLAFDCFGDRVFACSAVGGSLSLELDEVLLCPVELGPPSAGGMEPTRMNGHDLTFEGDTGQTQRRTTDAAHGTGLEIPVPTRDESEGAFAKVAKPQVSHGKRRRRTTQK